MIVSAPADETTVDGASARLAAAVAAFPEQAYAVVDGGLFENLPTLLRRRGLFARSLFLDSTDVEIQTAGPWLVALDQAPQAAALVMALPSPVAFAVYWSCAGGANTLFRHLRSLAMARIPDWAADSRPANPEPTSVETYQAVFFRHYDPRVLGALLPALDAAQFARILGPAREIAFSSPDYGGLRRVVADDAWPIAPKGLLTVRGDQCSALIARRVSASQWRVAEYLRAYAAAQAADLDDRQLLAAVRVYQAEARAFGIRNEDAIGRWSYMQLTSGNRLGHEPLVIRFMADERRGATPEQRLDALFRERGRALAMRFG